VDLELGPGKLESIELRLTDPVSTTRITTLEEDNSRTIGALLKSQRRYYNTWYTKAKEKLRGDLKVYAIEDHDWSLLSWN